MDNETKRMLFDVTVWTIALVTTLVLCHTMADQGDFRERNIHIPR